MDGIEAKGLSSKYRSKAVLRDVSFTALPGTCTAIIGANGCGKTTLLSVLAGHKKPSSGNLKVDGSVLYGAFDDGLTENRIRTEAERHHFLRDHVGYVMQKSPLIDELTVADNLMLMYGDRKVLKADMERGILAKLRLQEFMHVRVDRLSGGMKRKATIGCALARHPRIILMDEAGAFLDLPGKAEIREWMVSFAKAGGTVIYTTHEEADLAVCNRLFLLKEGSMAELDPGLRGRALSEVIR